MREKKMMIVGVWHDGNMIVVGEGRGGKGRGEGRVMGKGKGQSTIG